MAAEFEFSHQFYHNSHKFFSENIVYTAVTALLLYCKENDIGPELEVDAIRDLFQNDFGFTSLTVPNPSQRAQQELNKDIPSFVARYSNQIDTLILLYYAGHGDLDTRGKGLWAANKEGGPTLSWWKAQQLLYDAVGDILVVLDCCNAALVVEGEKDEGKFEILGASAKGIRTPEPGKSSFTTILIKHIKRSLKRGKDINVRGIHGELLRKSHLAETPQYADLAPSNPRSIVLQPLRPPQHQGFIRKPSSFMMLKVSLVEDPKALRIADWLKTHAPKGVTAISVEALVLKARKLQGLVDRTAFPPGSIFSKLPQVAQSELLHQLSGLNTVIQAADDSAKSSTMHEGNPTIAKSMDAIDTSIAGVCKAVETPLLLDPQFSDRDGLDQADGDDGVAAVGAEDAFSLRRHLLGVSAIPEGVENTPEPVGYVNIQPRASFSSWNASRSSDSRRTVSIPKLGRGMTKTTIGYQFEVGGTAAYGIERMAAPALPAAKGSLSYLTLRWAHQRARP